MKLVAARELAETLMLQHGLSAAGWRFQFDGARRRFGVCRHRPKIISLSKALTLLNEEARVRNTITHEIAHALMPPGSGHNAAWAAVHKHLGGDGRRCYESALVAKPKAPIVGECPAGHRHERFKMPRVSQSCGQCSRSYNPAYSINWKKIA